MRTGILTGPPAGRVPQRGLSSAQVVSRLAADGPNVLGIVNPPRRSAAATIASCQAARITPVLITGDHPATARAIAAELGILLPGDDVIDCTDPAADLADPRARVFARATPEQSSPSSLPTGHR